MPESMNEGANGFHLFTVVTDGYGNLIAENEDGKEIARQGRVTCTCPDAGDEPCEYSQRLQFMSLTHTAFSVLNDPTYRA